MTARRATIPSIQIPGAPEDARLHPSGPEHDRGLPRLDRDHLAARLHRIGAAPDHAVNRRSDFDLNPQADRPFSRRRLRDAAVLAPLVSRPDGYGVILTVRSSHLPSHAGQIAFPGGKQDARDAGPLDAALRETEEEIGLARGHIDVLGELDPYETGTGFHIRPFVGLVTPPFELNPDPSEVDEVFETPLSFLMDPANHHLHSAEWQGLRRTYWAMPWSERYIWGATAGILRGLYERLCV